MAQIPDPMLTAEKATMLQNSNRPLCPEASANHFSKLFLVWIFPFVWTGWKAPLQDEDLWELRDFERGSATTGMIRQKWTQVLGKMHKHRLNSAIFHYQRPALMATGILKGIDTALGLLQPVFVNRLLAFTQNRDARTAEGIGWASSLLLSALLKAIIENHYFLRVMRSGMRVRSGLQGTIYDKSLRMSPSARANSSLGQIVNLMQLDTQRIGDFFQFFHVLWAAPVQIVVAVGLLYNYIGKSAIIGLLMTLATLPLQGWLMAAQVKLRKAGIGIADRRVKLMNEILQGVKGVKLYAWEQPFAEAVEKERAAEVKKIASTIWIRSSFMAIMMVIPIFIGVVTFSFFTGVFGEILDPPRIFTGIALLNQLRTPVLMLPMTINAMIDARIGMKRIERFLDLEDTNNYSRRMNSHSSDKKAGATKPETPTDEKSSTESSQDSRSGCVEVRHGEFEWSNTEPALVSNERNTWVSKCFPRLRNRKSATNTAQSLEANKNENEVLPPGCNSSGKYVLRDINVSFNSGKMYAIVGQVGSGKSSLIHAILGEMHKVEGEVCLDGSVAYVAQTPWILNDTLRNNITFGKKFDEKLYRKAIKVAALMHDIEMLPGGDLTAIGEKGINLSGGQKQRVSIARAVYADADVYLFDDPLSALDAHVGKHVFESCISRKGVLRDRLRVLVTNQLHLLPECDEILLLESGSVRCRGNYDTLLSSDELFKQLLSSNDNDMEQVENEAKESHTSATSRSAQTTNQSCVSSLAPCDTLEMSDARSRRRELEEDGGRGLIQAEERKTGNVVARAYYQYAVACGGVFIFTVLLLFWCATVALSVIVQWWLSFWSEQTVAVQSGEENYSLGFFLGIYFALAVGYALMAMFRSVWFLTLALYASKKLHNKMLSSVLRAPLSFFDTTPIGRILSRFSRDVNVLDELLPQFFQQMLTTCLNLIASYVFIGVVFPYFFAVAVPVTIFYFGLQRFFNRTSLELKRLDSISKSPIYAHFSETLGGLSTIRAYGKQDQARNENMNKIDINQRAYFAYIAANRWFSLYLEMIGTLLIFATALFGVIQRNTTFSGDIGLSLTYALQVNAILGFSVRSITELEGQMNSVERVNYYSDELPQEAAAEMSSTQGISIPPGWPSDGQIDIKNVQMRYREGLDLVLKGVSLSIASGEKVGVVGRTGSGKSSLMIAILRLVELAAGEVLVDGLNLGQLGLNDVRKNITIIPQDPVIFSGTIRFNLDPFGEYTEAELWDALDKSHMKQFVSNFEGGLDAKVSEYGENLSAGQRQVICLTRALLRKSRILILDEASSSLDNETDRLIQETIRTHLKKATILTIAHRLFTLADYDKIVVMSDGNIAEFGRPTELLQRNGAFSQLVDSMGPTGSSQFRRLVSSKSESP